MKCGIYKASNPRFQSKQRQTIYRMAQAIVHEDSPTQTNTPKRRRTSDDSNKVQTLGRAVGQLACVFVHELVKQCTLLTELVHNIHCCEGMKEIHEALAVLKEDDYDWMWRFETMRDEVILFQYGNVTVSLLLDEVAELIYYCRKTRIAEATIGDHVILQPEKQAVPRTAALRKYWTCAAKLILLNEVVIVLKVIKPLWTTLFHASDAVVAELQTIITKYETLFKHMKTQGEWKQLIVGHSICEDEDRADTTISASDLVLSKVSPLANVEHEPTTEVVALSVPTPPSIVSSIVGADDYNQVTQPDGGSDVATPSDNTLHKSLTITLDEESTNWVHKILTQYNLNDVNSVIREALRRMQESLIETTKTTTSATIAIVTPQKTFDDERMDEALIVTQ